MVNVSGVHPVLPSVKSLLCILCGHKLLLCALCGRFPRSLRFKVFLPCSEARDMELLSQRNQYQNARAGF